MRQARTLLVVATAFLALPPIAGALALDDLLDQARRASVPPGWLR
jgi:hypothetical protein